MGRSCFSRVLLLSFLLLLFCNGFGRKLLDSSSVQEEHEVLDASEQGKSREVIELDYEDAGPNVNGRSGYLLISPLPSPSPPSPPSPLPSPPSPLPSPPSPSPGFGF